MEAPIGLAKELADKIILASEGKIESVILDQWRTNEDQWSLTYGGSYIEKCENNCGECKIYLTASTPEIAGNPSIRTVPIESTQGDRKNYGPQMRLNCKTIDQYIGAFVACFTQGYTLESIDKEMSYVKGFKLIYLKGVTDLAAEEKNIKKRILDEIIDYYEGSPTKEIFIKKAIEMDLR